MSDSTVAEQLTDHVCLSSLLGIKDSLRLRRDSTHQRPHVILRRVYESDDSSDDGDDRPGPGAIIHFKLYTHKHLNLKPGRELLLTVESLDDTSEDQLFMFEGTLDASDEESDREDTTQVEEEPLQMDEEDEDALPHAVMPPKMRRREWVKKGEVSSAAELHAKRPVAHASVGVQTTTPTYSSTPVQTRPFQNSVAVQATPSMLSAATQAVSSLVSTSGCVQVQTELCSQAVQIESAEIHETCRSLSIDTPVFPESGDETEISPAEEDFPLINALPTSPNPIILDPSDAVKLASMAEGLSRPLDSRTGSSPFVSAGGTIDKTNAGAHSSLPVSMLDPTVLGVNLPQTDSLDVPQRGATRNMRETEIGAATASSSSAPSTELVSNTIVSPNSSLIPTTVPSSPRARILSKNRYPVSSTALPTLPAALRNALASGSKIPCRPPSPTHPPPPLPAPTEMIPRGVQAKGKGKEKADDVATVVNLAEAREAVVVATGPYSNRLNIQPSSVASSPNPTPVAPTAKKRVVINAGGPLLARPKKLPRYSGMPRHRDETRAEGLVLGYGSPSPPPQATSPSVIEPPTTPPGKWKRIAPAISPSVFPNQEPEPDTSGNLLTSPSSTTVPPPVTALPVAQETITTLPKPDPDRKILADTREGQPAVVRTDLDLPGEHACLQSLESSISALEPSTTSQAEGENRRRKRRRKSASSNDQVVTNSCMVVSDVVKPSLPSLSAVNENVSLYIPPVLKHPLPAKPLNHPLPAKPATDASAWAPTRGIKRERAPSPDLWTAPDVVRIPKRTAKDSSRNVEDSFGRQKKEDGIGPIDVDLLPPIRIKRERSPSPDLQAGFSGSTSNHIKATHVESLTGDGELGVAKIIFNSDGSRFALLCQDNTLRIWDSGLMREMARLPQTANAELAWMDKDLVSLSRDGVLRKWIKKGVNWERIPLVCVSPEQCSADDKLCLTVVRGRIAVSCPRFGVYVWIWSKGSWVAQRSISRTNVTALKFIDEGNALVGGTRDGVLWHCAVPNGTMKAYAFLQSSITSISINPTSLQALISQTQGSACVVSIASQDSQRVKQAYANNGLNHVSLGARFASQGNIVVYGARDGCLKLWDAQNGSLVYGMEYAEGDLIQVVASCDGPRPCVLAGTQDGRLLRWDAPAYHSAPVVQVSQSSLSRKRVRTKRK
ncbi:hypothetical protein C8F01DRAFT_84045 [Mycena amicta]|nr:hypothetical protein C8F01DRAFT_84045 [Mycena amicta]